MGEPTSTLPTLNSIFLLPSPPQRPPSPPPLPASFLPPPETPTAQHAELAPSIQRPPIRLTSEFDSDKVMFFHKVSCKFLDNLAKLKLSFQNDRVGEVKFPKLEFFTKYFSVLYDVESRRTVMNGSFGVGKRLQFRASHDVKEEQGEVSMVACLADPSYKLELSSCLPFPGLPKAAFRFPLGEALLEKRNEEIKAAVTGTLSLNGILKNVPISGMLTVSLTDEAMRFRYSYKDKEMTFTPCLSLPSDALSFAFKRRFDPSAKLSYWFHFNTNNWSAVYKRTAGKDLKFKAGYDSDVRLGWASLWFGDETGRTKTAPMKMKFQVMFQVPQDDLRNSIVLFRFYVLSQEKSMK